MEYFYYDDPFNGDMHEVVPRKFVAFRGPVDANQCAATDCSPEQLLEVFKSKKIRTVIRLNERVYDAAAFLNNGIDHHDLKFQDCATPPDRVVDKFLRICEESEGLIAVHCLVSACLSTLAEIGSSPVLKR